MLDRLNSSRSNVMIMRQKWHEAILVRKNMICKMTRERNVKDIIIAKLMHLVIEKIAIFLILFSSTHI